VILEGYISVAIFEHHVINIEETKLLYKMRTSDDWMTDSVVALDDETFMILGGRGGRKVFRDVELKPDKNGKYIINIEYLDLKFFLLFIRIIFEYRF